MNGKKSTIKCLLIICIYSYYCELVLCDTTCFVDDLENGSSIIFTEECGGSYYKRLVFKNYSISDTFERPQNSSKYLSSSGYYDECLLTRKLNIASGTSLVLRILTYFDGNGVAPQCFIGVKDAEFVDWITSSLRTFQTDNKDWEDWSIEIKEDAEAVITVQCGPVTGKSILAIDNIEISAKTNEDCSFITSEKKNRKMTTMELNTTEPITTETTTTELSTTEYITTERMPSRYLCGIDDFEIGYSVVFNQGCKRVYPKMSVRNYIDGNNFNNTNKSTSYLAAQFNGFNCLERTYYDLRNPIFIFHTYNNNMLDTTQCHINIYDYKVGKVIYSKIFYNFIEEQYWEVNLSKTNISHFQILLLCNMFNNRPTVAIDYIEVYSDRFCDFNFSIAFN